MSPYADIISLLPYKAPFHFVDELTELSPEHAKGKYTIKEDEYFFRGHFPDNPIVPGAILGEIMAQIGLVSLGIFLTAPEERSHILPAFTHMNVDFLSFAKPLDTLYIHSEKIYFRFGKLKCKVSCMNQNKTLIASGDLSGVVIKQKEN